MSTFRFGLPYLAEGQSNAEVSHNEALDFLTTFVGLYIEDRDLTAPPTISDGEVYVVASGATGLWDGHDGELAIALNQAWEFKTNENGTLFWIADEGGGGVYLNSYNFRNLGPRIALRRTSTLVLSGETDVEWESQIAIDGHFTHSTSTDKEKINIVDDGLYEIQTQVTFERTAGSGSTRVVVRAYDGAVQIPGAEVEGVWNASAADPFFTLSLNRIDSLSGAYIKVTAEVVSGATCRIASKGIYLKISRP